MYVYINFIFAMEYLCLTYLYMCYVVKKHEISVMKGKYIAI